MFGIFGSIIISDGFSQFLGVALLNDEQCLLVFLSGLTLQFFYFGQTDFTLHQQGGKMLF
jgi:hypothetical protein